MPETSSDQEQQKKVQPASEAAQLQPAVEAPTPELDGLTPLLSRGPGLGSPDGVEQRAGDSRLGKDANRPVRAQTLTAMQRQFGNQRVQRFMVQRRLADSGAPVQREGGEDDKDAANTITIDENGVTNVVYNMDFKFKDEKDDPDKTPDGTKPDDDKVTTSATVIVTLKAAVSINLPSVPTNLSACQKARVKDAIDNKLSPHESQHEAAMKTFDAVVEQSFSLPGVKRADAAAARKAKGKEIADKLKADRQKTAQDASDKLDKPPFVINVDLNCEDEKKPGKKDVEDTGAQEELAGGGDQSPAGGAE